MRSFHLAARAACLLGGLAGFGGAAGAVDPQVTIANFTFAPQPLTVKAGTKVTWVNHDDIPHTVVSRDAPAAFRSAPLDTDDSFAVVLARAGIYRYFCSIHPQMQGTIVVR